MGHDRTQAPGSGRLRTFRLGVSPLRRRAGVPRGNRKAREGPAGAGRPAAAAARRGCEISVAVEEETLMQFSVLDHAHMARALRLAELGLFTTQPNPRVG